MGDLAMRDLTMYTVKQLSDLAGVSVRTLHHYDAIGLLKPSHIGANGYRYYDEAALLRLQQILFYREIGIELPKIKALLDAPDFDVTAALRSHRAALQAHIDHQQTLIRTIDSTLQSLAGEHTMSKKQLFEGFKITEEEQEQYTREARLQYDPAVVDESIRRYKSYSQAEKDKIAEESNQFYSDLIEAIDAGKSADSDVVQQLLERWHQHLHYFYEPTLEILRGLGELYNTDVRFIANFQKLHPDLPAYLQTAITTYVDQLEDAEIRRLLAEDDAQGAAGDIL